MTGGDGGELTSEPVEDLRAQSASVGAAMHIVDINNDFAVLPPTWQEENLAAAKGTLKIITENPGESDDYYADMVHKDWLSRNTWCTPDDPLGAPYSELTPTEQAKDMCQVLICKLVYGVVNDLQKKFDAKCDEVGAGHSKLLDAAAVNDMVASSAMYKASSLSGSRGADADSGDGGGADNAEHEALLTSDGGAAATSDGDGGTTTSATADADVPSPAKPIDFDFDGFVKLCLEDIEKVVAQELYGKDMVSIVDDIRHQKEAMVRHSSVHGFRDGFTTTSAEGNRPSHPRSC